MVPAAFGSLALSSSTFLAAAPVHLVHSRPAGQPSGDARSFKLQQRDQELYEPLYRAGVGDGAIVIGLDEVGRGALAGSLTVAAVALPLEPRVFGLDDSKRLSARKREELLVQIKAVALAIGIAHIQPSQIDAQGMAACLPQAFAAALAATDLVPDLVLVDGRPLGIHPAEHAIIKGDRKVACIAAASIVAKVCRDALMVEAADIHDNYGWRSNKGYGSAAHIAAIREWGLSPLHRSSFCGSFLQASLF
ncbi:MAG: ribonuclease HII [Coriobacteriales bacterium]|nr:ribonuclease HII [Coriobacteriales bacterium]